MPESVLILLAGIAGAVLRDILSALLNRRKNKSEERKSKSEEVQNYANAIREGAETIEKYQNMYDEVLEREKKREKEFNEKIDAQQNAFNQEIEIRRKAFDRIYKDYAQLRDEKLLSDEQNLELMRSKNGEILVLNREIAEIKTQAAQWKAEASGLRALQGKLQEDVTALKISTGKLELEQGKNN